MVPMSRNRVQVHGNLRHPIWSMPVKPILIQPIIPSANRAKNRLQAILTVCLFIPIRLGGKRFQEDQILVHLGFGPCHDGDKLLVRLELLVGRDSPIKGGPDLWLHVLVLPFERLITDKPNRGPTSPSVMKSARQLARVPVKHVQQ